jgi:peptide/nickel transport system permease protein
MKPPLARPHVRASLVFLAMLVLIATFADLIASDTPLLAAAGHKIVLLPKAHGPWDWAVSAPLAVNEHMLGRTIHAARSSVLVTASVVALALAFGVPLGAAAGYGPPLFNALLSRAVELSGALPTLVVLAIVQTNHAVHGLTSFIAVLAVLSALRTARLVRGEVMRVAGQEFIVAARAIGTPRLRLVAVQVLPHVMGPVLVVAAFTAANVVALEAAFSFVGLGLPEQIPSWGSLLGSADKSGSLLLPALSIAATTGACFLVADALDDALSARRGRSRT